VPVFSLDLPTRTNFINLHLNSEIKHADTKTHITFQLIVYFMKFM